MMTDRNEVLNDIASAQATIDQAYQHLEEHKHVFTEDQYKTIKAEIDFRQDKLNAARIFVKEVF